MKIKFNFSDMKWEGITVNQVKLWEQLYKDTDVVNEITVEMVRWLDKVKGTKKANKRAWKKFIVNWLKRSQQKAVLG
jgi:hypothetical protein